MLKKGNPKTNYITKLGEKKKKSSNKKEILIFPDF